MKNVKFNTAGVLNGSWTYLILANDRDNHIRQQDASSLMGVFHQSLMTAGVIAPPPKDGLILKINKPGEVDQPLKKFAASMSPPKLIIVVLPSVDTLLYNRIKQLGDVELGIQTVCVTSEKFAKAQQQYFANVALKINLKLGGINQLMDQPGRLGIISEDKTMVIGIDVTHPSPGSSSNAPSVAGMVGSVDRWLGQWPAALRIQEARKEMVTDLEEMLKSRLQLWLTKGKHAALPENLLVYRDGVSEGQYQQVLDQELPLLRGACKKMYPPPDQAKGLPKITIVIVGKRHHTRFYPTKAEHADSSSNTKAGTVVDRGVTETRNWDFYLQAHTALKGTARPAHYYVVLDEIFSKRRPVPPFQHAADVLEDLTHNMCYLYGRATKAVSICTPAYYADIVCERARRYLSGVFDSPVASEDGSQGPTDESMRKDSTIHLNLQNSMFYI